MKKIIALIILILANIILIIYINSETTINTKTIPVINVSNNNYEYYTLKTTINSKELFNYINDNIKIIEIVPKTNILNLKYYSYQFNYLNIKANINLFEKNYKNELIKNGKNKEANLIRINGIDIDKIIIYSNLEDLNALLKTNKFVLE